jgi:hypothetical protein
LGKAAKKKAAGAKSPAPSKKGKGKGWANLYRAEYAVQTAKLMAKGFLLSECAEFFEVSDRTFRRWMATHEDLFKATLIDQTQANARVELTAYQMAVGYERDEEEIKVIEGEVVRVKVRKYYPPNPASNIWWTKAKMGWRDDDIAKPPGGEDGPMVEGHGVQPESLRQTARRLAFVLHKGGKAA